MKIVYGCGCETNKRIKTKKSTKNDNNNNNDDINQHWIFFLSFVNREWFFSLLGKTKFTKRHVQEPYAEVSKNFFTLIFGVHSFSACVVPKYR